MKREKRRDTDRIELAIIRISGWMKRHRFPPGLLLIILGILSTVWFLIRVIPKPSRATYPCMQVAAPIMSGFVVYLLSLGGITLAFRRLKKSISGRKYLAAGFFLVVAASGLVISLTRGSVNSFGGDLPATGPDDGPNQPFGTPMGDNPGRVVWVWNPKATNEKCLNTFESKDYFFKPENTHKDVVRTMVRDALTKLSGKKSIPESWDLLFRYHNLNKFNADKGYTRGEKILIKINQGTSRWLLTQDDKDKGYYYPQTFKPTALRQSSNYGATETGPYIVLELLSELIDEAGIDPADIAVGDPMTDIYGHNYDIWHARFPGVVYIDKFSTMHGRTLTRPGAEDRLFYANKTQKDKIYEVVENADYLINVANLKPHYAAGISLTAKNHFGSQARPTAQHLHNSLITPRGALGSNGGYHKYRVQVDLMGSKYLGRNTVLYLVDGLFGGGAIETKVPVKYFMAPFNDNWCNSIFVSQDQVALESVCYDFLRTEWNGVNQHDPANGQPGYAPNIKGVDDYLHQAADRSNWPEGVVYDPDNSGTPIPSLGVHEHWNNARMKQYSRNLGLNKGIELVSVPDTLVRNR
jgi:Domain of unknown function (DUF362)